ncbi:isoprenylcysteine carboxylmethyltransferase family protein [Chloroflexi bacterium CFX2]|nr:isoprenylcysteine carboxylmethyltransferase family protein [Chloroflexi bacterium CFX2]
MQIQQFFSSPIRIQVERGHVTVSSVTYRFIRHPGYLGMIVMHLSAPVAFGSIWAMVCGGISGCLYILRTAPEDRTVQEELTGYKDYAGRVRFHLLPGVW